MEITAAPFICNPDGQPAQGLPFKPSCFAHQDSQFGGSCAVSCEIRITHSIQLQSALYPALLRNLEGSMSNQPCQCKSDGLVQIKLLQFFFLSYLGPETGTSVLCDKLHVLLLLQETLAWNKGCEVLGSANPP